MRGLKLPIIHGHKIFSLITDGIFRNQIGFQQNLTEPGQSDACASILRKRSMMLGRIQPFSYLTYYICCDNSEMCCESETFERGILNRNDMKHVL